MKVIKRRGRPKGPGIDDVPTLQRIASLIVASPGLKPTTAIHRIIPNAGPSEIRRLQVKWKAGATEYLAEARAVEERWPVRTSNNSINVHNYSAAITNAMTHNDLINAMLPATIRLKEMMESPGYMAVQEAARRLREDSGLQAAHEAALRFQNDPALRVARDVAERISSLTWFGKGM